MQMYMYMQMYMQNIVTSDSDIVTLQHHFMYFNGAKKIKSRNL